VFSVKSAIAALSKKRAAKRIKYKLSMAAKVMAAKRKTI
jgi:hypothetical protein